MSLLKTIFKFSVLIVFLSIDAFSQQTITAALDSLGTTASSNLLQLNSSAVFSNPYLTLTDGGHNEGGSAFFKKKVVLRNSGSFSAYFDFKIDLPDCNSDDDDPDASADGIAFVLQAVANTAGSVGGGLGYAGISPSIAIEFDTFNNGAGDDNNGNHIGLSLNGNTSSVQLVHENNAFDDGGTKAVWIDYDGTARTLEVRYAPWITASRPTRPTLASLTYTFTSGSAPSDFIGSDVFAGITAATGGCSARHQISSFFFNNDLLTGGITPGTTSYVSAPTQVSANAVPTTILNDGADSSVVTATVLNILNTPVPSENVSFSTSRGSLSTSSSTTDSLGQTTTNLTSTSTGSTNIRASIIYGAYADVAVAVVTPASGGSATATPTATRTSSATPTATQTATTTATTSPTPSPTNTSATTSTATPTMTATPTATTTLTSTPTVTASATATPTATGIPTDTYTPTPTNTNVPSSSPTPSVSPSNTPAATASPTNTVAETLTPAPSSTPTALPTATQTDLPLITATPSLSPTPSLLPPVISTPPGGNTTSDPLPTISGKALAGAFVEVFIDGVSVGATTADNDGNFAVKLTSPLTAGSKTVRAFQTLNGERSQISQDATLIVKLLPVLDFDGDGSTDPGVYHVSKNTIYFSWIESQSGIRKSTSLSGAYAAAADYLANGKTQPATVSLDKQSLVWKILDPASGTLTSENFGRRGNIVLSGCRFVTSDRSALAIIDGNTLKAKNLSGANTLQAALRRLGKADVVGCGDIDGDGLDELIVKQDLRSSNNFIAYHMDGGREILKHVAADLRALVVRRPGNAVPLVALSQVFSNKRKVKLDSLTGTFDFPTFTTAAEVDITGGLFRDKNGAQIPGVLWRPNNHEELHKLVVSARESGAEILKINKEDRLTRSINIINKIR